MFDSAVYAARRDAVMRMIGPNAVVVVASQPERLRNGDAYHLFRQASDVYYLTGFSEPETTLVLRPGAETDRVVMFVRPRDPEMEVWDGQRAGVDGAKAISAPTRRTRSDRTSTRGSPRLFENVSRVYYRLGRNRAFDDILLRAIDRTRGRARSRACRGRRR